MEIVDMFVVVAKVEHSQSIRDPLVNIWIITEKDGTIISAHYLDYKAGLSETCSHVTSALFYIEAITWIQGKLTFAQVKGTWVLPTYVNKVPYARAKDIDFSSAQKLKTTWDQKIVSLPSNDGEKKKTNTIEQHRGQQFGSIPCSDREVEEVYAKLNNCHNKAVVLSFIDPYADQFIDESCTLRTVSELFQTKNLDLQYLELLKLCTNITLNISENGINKVEINS